MKEKTLNKIRTINFQGLCIGNSRPFLCLEFSAFSMNMKIFAQRGAGEDTGAGEDIFGIRFDIQNETEIAQLMPYVCKINGCIDLVLGGKKRWRLIINQFSFRC